MSKPDLREWLRFPARVGWRDHVVGALLAVVYVAWLLATARSLGFSRDEGFYFHAATSYARWFEMLFSRPADAIKQSVVDGTWAENHEHPSLCKSAFAFSWMLFHEKWHVFKDASTAFRFPGMLAMGMAMWTAYLFGARAYSRRAGVIAAVLLGLMPRVFYNAHLACFDVPIMAMWTWCIYVYWRAQQEGGLGWALATGVAYGLTLDTKHNAWILPAVLVPHALWVRRRDLGRQLRSGVLPIPAPIVAMAILGPAILYALWPWMWFNTVPRVQEYLNFHLNHVYYNMEFLHVNYFDAPSPRGYMPVMILGTVPTITLLLFAIGVVSRASIHVRRVRAWVASFGRKSMPAASESTKDDAMEEASAGDAAAPASVAPAKVRSLAPDAVETDLLFFLAIGAALGPWLLPKTPIFGGTKHWLTAYPFLTVVAGHGFDRVADALKRALPAGFDERRTLAAQAALVACVVIGPLAVTAHSHPFGLSSYVPLVGGTAGGADLGLNRQFWGFTTESLAPYFETAPPRAAVFIHDTAWESWSRMIQEKRIRPDLRGVGAISDAEIAIVHIEQHMMEVEYKTWPTYGTDIPDYVLAHDGVPIIDVFRRRH